MSESGQNSAEHALPSGRLNGWKEIAVFLGKSVRTVQRWEKELSLPVHRIHTSRGEIIWAVANEIDEWLSRTEIARAAEVLSNGHENGVANDEPASHPAISTEIIEQLPSSIEAKTTPWRGWRMVLAAVGVLAVAGSLWVGIWIGRRGTDTPPVARKGQPAGFRVEKDKLVVLDEVGRILWTHIFPQLLALGYYQDSEFHPLAASAQIADLDGDQTNEVIFVVHPTASAETDLYVFAADGSIKFTHRPGRGVRYGRENYSPPFYISNLMIASGPEGKRTLWLAAHHNTWFPTVVEKITPEGKVASEYWSNGHINELAETTWNGRKVILVGAMYNDGERASLAVLDYENANGSAPASNPAYRCEDCPAGQPLLFYVFPRMEISRLLDVRPRITTLRVTSHGDVLVAVEQAGDQLSGDSGTSYGTVFYTFDAQFNLKSAEAVDTYRMLHGKLELLGKLKHAYGARDDAELLPVLKWGAKKFVPAGRSHGGNLSSQKPAAIARR